MACLKCNSVIDENEQYYVVDLMGPEIISVIERNFGQLVDGSGVMCSQCFVIIMLEISYDSAPADHNLQHHHVSNACVRCRTSLFRRRTHSIPEGVIRQYIASAIAPREIPDGGLLCFSCWIHTQRKIQQQGIALAPVVVMNTNECVWCQRSLAKTRSHSLPEGPERTIIAEKIYPREILPGGLVCYACWVAARRNVEHAKRNEDNQQTSGPSNLHQDSVCAWCRTSLHRRRTHVASGPVRDEVAARVYPNELPVHALLCSNCWNRAQGSVGTEQEIVQLAIEPPNATITLDSFAHTTHTSARCFVPACNNTERNKVPRHLRKTILKSVKIFVTENARICNEHKSLSNWDFLTHNQFSKTFTKNEIESMLRLSIQDDG